MLLDIGAHSSIPIRRFAIYIPDADKEGQPVEYLEGWIEEALFLLTDINGGATRMAPAQGRYRNDAGVIIKETTHVVYSHVDPSHFFDMQGLIASFLQRFLKGANQETVFVEFDGEVHIVNLGGAVVVPFPHQRIDDDHLR